MVGGVKAYECAIIWLPAELIGGNLITKKKTRKNVLHSLHFFTVRLYFWLNYDVNTFFLNSAAVYSKPRHFNFVQLISCSGTSAIAQIVTYHPFEVSLDHAISLKG